MPYKDPQVRKAYKHQYYENHKQKIILKVKKYQSEHRDMKRRIDHNYNQKKNAPYHGVLEEAGADRVCCKCGSTEYVCTHHIDGDRSNNNVENLVWLCVRCHGKLHRRQQLEGMSVPPPLTSV